MARQSREAARVPVLPPILMTRPQAQGDRFAALLRERFGPDVRLVCSPLIAPEFLTPRVPADLRGVIFTSETGVAGFARLWHGGPLPAWCVGDRTAEAALAAGFAARSAQGDAADLVTALLAEAPFGPLLHARGRDTRGDVAGSVTKRGIIVSEAIVYAQIERPLTEAATAILRGPGPVAVPLFSPRTARLLAQRLPPAPLRAPLWIAALGPAVAEAAAAVGPARSALARRPDAAAMIDALFELACGAAQP